MVCKKKSTAWLAETTDNVFKTCFFKHKVKKKLPPFSNALFIINAERTVPRPHAEKCLSYDVRKLNVFEIIYCSERDSHAKINQLFQCKAFDSPIQVERRQAHRFHEQLVGVKTNSTELSKPPVARGHFPLDRGTVDARKRKEQNLQSCGIFPAITSSYSVGDRLRSSRFLHFLLRIFVRFHLTFLLELSTE